MAVLDDQDLRLMLGEDFKRRMNTSVETNASSSAEEKAAARGRRLNQLGDLRFSFFAVMFLGVAQILGALYTRIGFESLQAELGAVAVAIGIAGMIFSQVKLNALHRQPLLAA